jgi:hypothetical protein
MMVQFYFDNLFHLNYKNNYHKRYKKVEIYDIF